MSPQNKAVTRTDGYVIYYTEKIGKDNVPDQTRSVDIRSAKYGISNSAAFAISFCVFATFLQSTGGVRQATDNERTS